MAVLGVEGNRCVEGGDAILQGLALCDREWGSMATGQGWAAGRRGADKAAAILCSDYPNAGVYCLGLRLHPREHIVWLEEALEAAQILLGHERADVTQLYAESDQSKALVIVQQIG